MIQRIFFIVVLFCTVTANSVRADEGPFKVEIMSGNATKSSLPSGAPLTLINVHTRIINISDSEQTLRFMSCKYSYSWQTDAPEFSVGFEVCSRNVPMSVQLKSGEDYKRDLQLTLLSAVKPGKFKFRLGFKPGLDPETATISGEPVWSEVAVIKIDKEMLKGIMSERGATGSIMKIKGASFDDLSPETKAFLANSGLVTVPGGEDKK